MGLVEVLVLAVGLSMDAFAVSVCKGLAMGKIKWKHIDACLNKKREEKLKQD